MVRNMTYAGVGVDYGSLDEFKRRCQRAGRATAGNILRSFGGAFREVDMSRGESVYLVEAPDSFLAHVEEGLGTKNLVADEMYRLTGKTYYDHIGQDTVAMIVNDLITLGALPLDVAMHLAVGDSKWFNDEKRLHDLVGGWQNACNIARCAWGPGETPTLKGIIVPEAVVLAGSALGVVKPKKNIIAGNIRHGDAIVLAESSGIHANGLTMARDIADRLPNGYLTQIDGGRTFGEALLDPTHIYVGLVGDCISRGVSIHYAVNITGHGWRKLMRAEQPFAYIVEKLPRQLPIFDFLQREGPVNDMEAYGTLNMGAGFALYVPEDDVGMVLEIAAMYGITAFHAGHIEQSDHRKVVIEPKHLEYSGSTLGVR